MILNSYDIKIFYFYSEKNSSKYSPENQNIWFFKFI